MPMTDSLVQLVAATIRSQMAFQQKQQTDLGEYLGVKQPTISRKLAGKTQFRIDELQKIAEFLDVPVDTFFSKAAA